LRIVFAGTPRFAVPTLEALLRSAHRLLAVYTQPDRPAGRGLSLRASPVKTLAAQWGIPVYQPLSLNDPDVLTTLLELEADVMVVVAYGLILPAAVLTKPRLGCVNVHASLLPRWRGAAPIPRAILAGDTETGVTLMQMDQRMDTGAILAVRRSPIGADDTTASLHDRLADLGAELLMENLELLQKGALVPRAQDDRLACYAPKIKKAEARLDWRRSAVELARAVQAFNPWPVAETRMEGTVLRILRAAAMERSTNEPPGTVVAASKQGIDVATGHNTLRLLELQLPARRPVSALDFLNARPLSGMCFA
jgi:methionyl-tRNA formyltransferase